MPTIIGRRADAAKTLSRYRGRARLFLTLSVLACNADRPTAPDDVIARTEEDDAATSTAPATSTPPTESGMCPACAFGPRVYTRTTGQPVTDVATFPGNPAGAYIVEIDDHGSQGANATVVLNGRLLSARSGYFRAAVPLQETNRLETRLTGKPGSTLEVSIFQEVHRVTVTPNLDLTRLPATQQFTAVARDANDVVIPNQTFEWQSSDTKIATIGVSSGLGKTTGAVNNEDAWTYETFTTGEGTTQIDARAIGSTVHGSVPWRISAGFVYTTFRAPRALNSPKRLERPNPVGLRYDVARLHSISARCDIEQSNQIWLEFGPAEGLFKRCFPALEMTTLERTPGPFGNYIFFLFPNVGLYGRYCGAGHPGGANIDAARDGNYDPKDPIDAMCMEHDRQGQNHDLSTDDVVESTLATCIVRYGIETETLNEDGVRIQPGSARWVAFWNAWPEMAAARAHFLDGTRVTCPDGAVVVGGVTIPDVYGAFLLARGLTR